MIYTVRQLIIILTILICAPLSVFSQEYICLKVNDLDSSLSHYYVVFGQDVTNNEEVIMVLDKSCGYLLGDILLNDNFCDFLDTVMIMKEDVFSEDSTKIITVSEFKSVITDKGKIVLSIKQDIYPLMPKDCFKIEFYNKKRKHYEHSDYMEWKERVK